MKLIRGSDLFNLGRTMERLQSSIPSRGPCVGCGRRNYPLSMGGPTVCPECDMGIDPKTAQLRRDYQELSAKHFDALLALQIALNYKDQLLTPKMRERGEAFIKSFTRDSGANQMTWQRFWELGEKFSDRFWTIGIGIIVIDLMNGADLQATHWKAIITCYVIALVGGMFCSLFAVACKPEDRGNDCAVVNPGMAST